MIYTDLLRQWHQQPFQPFSIRLIDGRSFDVEKPRRVIIGEASAVIVTDFQVDDRGCELALDWTTISIAHIVSLADTKPTKRRRRSA